MLQTKRDAVVAVVFVALMFLAIIVWQVRAVVVHAEKNNIEVIR